MRDQVSRLVGLDGVQVSEVWEVRGQLDLEVELAARAGCCPGCGRASLTVKERPVVRVRDLPLAGRPTYLLWRKRRYGCDGCGRTFTETHPELPAASASPRAFAGGWWSACAAAPRTPRSPARSRRPVIRWRARSAMAATRVRLLAQPARRGACRWTRPITAAAASWRPWCQISTGGAWSRCSTGAAAVASSATCARSLKRPGGRSRSSRSIPTTPTARRSAPSCRTRGSSATASTWSAAPTPRWTPSGANVSASAAQPPEGARRGGGAAKWRPALYHARHRLLKASERLSDRDRRRLCELFAHDPILAEAWALKEAFRAVYHASDRADAERRLDALPGRRRPRAAARLRSLRQRRRALA